MKWTYFFLLIFICASGCKITKAVKNGQMAYDLKQYAVAIPMLEKEYKSSDDREVKGHKAKLLGASYNYLQDYTESVRWYEKAIEHRIQVPAQLAAAYKKNEQYTLAKQAYDKLCKETSEARWCKEAALCAKAISEPLDDSVEITTFAGNTKYSEYSPVFFEEDFLVFTSDRKESIGSDTYNWTGQSFSDLFVVNLQGRKVNNFDAIINTAANEGTACFSKDFNEIYFTRCESINLRDQHCRIYFSQRPNGFWMEPEPLMFFDEKTNFAHAALIEKDSVLIFSAAPANGDGTYDLYYSERVDGGWSAPDLLPSKINSIGNEKFATSDGDTLYFASDGLPGFGGFDLFRTYLQDGSWSVPENLGRPINSGADDFGLAVDVKGSAKKEVELQGYLTSSRNVGTGDDIFFFTKYVSKDDPTEEEPPLVDTKNSEPKIFIAVLAGSENKVLPLDRNGFALEELEKERTYVFTASKTEFLATRVEVRTDFNLIKDTTINLELALDRIVYDKEIILNDIYYDYDKWEIRTDAKPALDSLQAILTLNPGISILLGSHTDCRGEVDYNLDLSQKRAASAKSYLLSEGISASRMKSVGYGESNPIIRCDCDSCTDAEHQRNRRTTFKIVKE